METMRPLYIPVILGTTRQGRMSQAAARLLHAEVAKRPDVESDLIDIATFPMRTDDAGEAIKDRGFATTKSGTQREASPFSMEVPVAKKHHVVIVGGGFGGLYAALELERTVARNPFQVTLINRENFFLFTPMLHEVAASDLDVSNIVNPARKLLKHVSFFEREVRQVYLEAHTVTVEHGSHRHSHELEFDQIVLALGCINHFLDFPELSSMPSP